MHSEEELRLRRRDDDAEDDVSQASPSAAGGSLSVLGTTSVAASYPTIAGRFYVITINQILGTESEGATATFANQPGTIAAYNLGSAVPPLGTTVICTYVPHRWVFRYD